MFTNAFQTESEKRALDQKWQLDLVIMLTGGPNGAFILPCIFWLMAIVMRIVNSKHIVLLKGVNITKQELCQSKKNCNFFNVLTIARTLALILSPVYLGLCWFETDLFYTTHVGALTIFLVWLNVTFTLGKYPTFGIYITIVNYVGLEVFRLIILYMTTFIGNCLI